MTLKSHEFLYHMMHFSVCLFKLKQQKCVQRIDKSMSIDDNDGYLPQWGIFNELNCAIEVKMKKNCHSEM